ncbi:outer membrane protein [Denitrobaculum tricleocarpae]|uniref:Porin family protein n=1 Tax=Denitrobaculum tricleocarpae TaxID=2591009 RepID=A0A545T7Z7_9PROT|nr:outer membrane beta-barrel protein [Denitrobaculum tricleocarpae]TQV73340.1 porin family protein [Denitrobaculum tricleocarpae]
MKALLIGLSALTLLGFTSAAQAQFYLGAQGGVSIQDDSDADEDGISGELGYSEGFALGALGGYRFGLNDSVSLDIEGEVTYRDNDVDDLTIEGVDFDADGDLTSFAFMANGWLNWHVGSGFSPYVGGGVGVLHVELEDLDVSGVNIADDSDTVLAGQLGAGVAYAVTENVELSLDYRFLIADDADFEGTETEMQNHSVLIGFKYLF